MGDDTAAEKLWRLVVVGRAIGVVPEQAAADPVPGAAHAVAAPRPRAALLGGVCAEITVPPCRSRRWCGLPALSFDPTGARAVECSRDQVCVVGEIACEELAFCLRLAGCLLVAPLRSRLLHLAAAVGAGAAGSELAWREPGDTS